ncbi:MAG: diaminopimelate epimerase [Phycisphaerae bacterium]|jgi:diaminopimelate epimerase|nr:diaminopimelate epimerase [Phycisphaerae bacterium]
MNVSHDVMMHGASNTFLIHFGDETPENLLRNHQDVDGLLVVKNDDIADASMRIYNANGLEAEQCGNGLRCVALHLVRNRMVDGNHVRIKTLSGINPCVVTEGCNEVAVTLSKPIVQKTRIDAYPNLKFVDMGNPNAVFWTEEDPLAMREQLGKKLCNLPDFKLGMNVHFARLDEEQYATCASWERGVGPTDASGTGGASVFVTSGKQGTFYVSSVGGTLHYHFDENGNVVLAGPASYL